MNKGALGGTCVVRQTKLLDRVRFKPLLNPFRSEAWQLPQAAFIFRQFSEELDPVHRLGA